MGEKEIYRIRNTKELNKDKIKDCYNKFLSDEKYKKDEELIKSIFQRLPFNLDPQIVALKICLIDVTNSTHLSQKRQQIVVSELANHIVSIKNFDERVKNGCLNLVNDVAKNKTTKNKTINLFSFASKYCAYHNRYVYGKDDYSIIDTRVAETIPKYISDISKSKIYDSPNSWRTKYEYEKYQMFIDDILNQIYNQKWDKDARRKLDIFFWSHEKKFNNNSDN